MNVKEVLFFVEVEKTRATRGREVKCVCSSTIPTHFHFPPILSPPSPSTWFFGPHAFVKSKEIG
jgi:hypothetical protein